MIGDFEGVPPLFVTTRWSVVLAAQDKSSPDSAAALETLCRAYWYPLYAYVRGSGRSPHDAQDLTQEFFARLLAQDWLRVVLPERGRFRTFLLVTMKRFLTNASKKIYTVMNTPLLPTCPKCGSSLPADAPKGLCPRCLAAMNLATETVLTGADALTAQPRCHPPNSRRIFRSLKFSAVLDAAAWASCTRHGRNP